MENALFQTLFVPTLTKAQRTQVKIIESTIKCYSSVGIDNTTIDKIAAMSATSRPLVLHYFPTREILAENVVKYIRANMQNEAVKAIKSAQSPKEQIANYIESVFQWVQDFDQHLKVWMLFYYYCGINNKFNDLNTKLVSMGHERIQELFKLYVGTRKVQDKVLAEKAKMAQILITGGMLCCATEKLPLSIKSLSRQTVEMCLSIAESL